MNWQQRMEAAIDYLESNLDGEIEYGRVAAAANCSTFHFLRMFEVVAGVSLGEYARRRRMSRAAIELAEGNDKIIDLALRWGYESPDSFAKAFKREFGVTPREARSEGVRLKTWPRLSFIVVLKGDIPMEFRIEKRDEFTVTGLPIRVTTEGGSNLRNIPEFWKRCCSDGSREALERAISKDAKIGGGKTMGVCVNDYDEKTKTFTYLIAIESPKGDAAREKLPAGTVDVVAPAGSWAVFPSHGPLPGSIQTVWKRVYSEWFPSSGYEHAGGIELEVYGPGDGTEEAYYCEIWLPVKKMESKN